VSPVVAVKIGEMDKGVLNLRIGDKEFGLPPASEKDVTLKNGASIHFSIDPVTGTLSWRALKGEFLISVDGVPGWKAVAVSDGAGEMHWDSKLRMVDMRNTSQDAMVVSLPTRTFGVLSPSSSFHYAAVGEAITNASLGLAGVSSYATAASGKVGVYNSNNRKTYDLGEQNLLFVGGLPTRLNLSGSRLPVQLSWDNGAPLFVAENQEHNMLKPGTQKVLKYGPDFHLGFVYSEGGTLKVTAVEGNFRLIIQRVNGLVVDLEEGCKVTLTLDLKKGTFVVRTDPTNPAALALALDNGSPISAMDADRYLNFNIAEDGSLFGDSGDGHVLFFDYAGADPSTVSFSQSIPGSLLPPPPAPYDPTRVPATVIQ
jgi:hypothetical protein